MSELVGTISEAQTTETEFLKRIFIRSQMSEFVQDPLLMTRAEGVHYWDVNGKKYLDALSGIYVASVGHNNPRVINALRQQLETLAFSPPMHGSNPIAVQLANRLVELGPQGMGAVKLLSGGSEATEAAIKMARQFHKLNGGAGKYKIISRYQSWHGSTLGSLSAGGLASRRATSEPLAPGFIHVFPPTCYRCPFGKEYPSCDVTCATLIGDVIEMEDPSTVAAVMVEPIGHTGGIIDPPDEYLPLLRTLCDKHNVLLIFDEIITGIGRTGEMFAAQTFGVTPDMICLGKGLSGGYSPIAALMCTQQIADTFWGDPAVNPGFVEGHTFEGNPVSSAVGLAVLDEIVEHDLCANARSVGKHLRSRFESLRDKHNCIGDIRGKGLFQCIEFAADQTTRQKFDPPIGQAIGKHALANGLLTRFDPHWIAFGPALNVTESQIDEMLAILDASITAVVGQN